MNKILMTLFLTLTTMGCWAQEAFSGIWQCEELKGSIVVNLVEKKIPLRDFDEEDTYGYLKGELNGTWVIMKIKELTMNEKERKALVRMVSDIGYDAQDVELKLVDESTMELRAVGEQVMKCSVKGKYGKMPKVSVFKKSE